MAAVGFRDPNAYIGIEKLEIITLSFKIANVMQPHSFRCLAGQDGGGLLCGLPVRQHLEARHQLHRPRADLLFSNLETWNNVY